MKRWSLKKVKGGEVGLGSGKKEKAVMIMSKMETNVLLLPSESKKYISVDERWFWTYVPNTLGLMNDRYVSEVLDDANIELLGVPKKGYEDCEEVEQDTVVVSINELKGEVRIIVMFTMFNHNRMRITSHVILW